MRLKVSSRIRIKKLGVFIGSFFLTVNLFTSAVSGIKLQTAQAATPQQLRFTSVDVMKWTKDTVRNQPTDAQINGIVTAIMDGIHPGYIAISIPLDATTNYASNNRPSPRTVEALTQKWSDVIHAHGAHVLWRGTWSGIEGIYDFPKRVGQNRFPAGTAVSAPTDGTSTWLGKTYGYIVDHPTYFSNGDIWAPMPERTEGIFNDATSFLPADGSGLQANYANFFNAVKTVSDRAFASIGKNALTGFTTNNFTEINSGWMYQSLIDTAGYIVIDHYGLTHTPQEMDGDLRRIYAQRGKPIFLQEWGDYWHPDMSVTDRTAYLQSMYAVFQQLVNEGILVGFNYWGAWDGFYEGILRYDGGIFQINYRGQLLAQFFRTVPSTPAAGTTTGSQAPGSVPQSTQVTPPSPATAPSTAINTNTLSSPQTQVQPPPAQKKNINAPSEKKLAAPSPPESTALAKSDLPVTQSEQPSNIAPLDTIEVRRHTLKLPDQATELPTTENVSVKGFMFQIYSATAQTQATVIQLASDHQLSALAVINGLMLLLVGLLLTQVPFAFRKSALSFKKKNLTRIRIARLPSHY